MLKQKILGTGLSGLVGTRIVELLSDKFEFENLEKELPALQKEKEETETKMAAGNLGFDELQKAAARIGELIELIDTKEMRWLELSERV